MLINVFGKTSNNSENKIDLGLFVEKAYLTTIYKESKIEEDLDIRNQYRSKSLPDPFSMGDACSKIYVDKIFKNIIDFNDVKLENINVVKVNLLLMNMKLQKYILIKL